MARGDGGDRESLTDRLMSRAEGLSRKSFGGVEVYSGPLARRALGALNARAFTMDRSIFVDPSFDPQSNPEDASLLAHEDVHRRNSGGEGGGASGHNDAEETLARRAEAMTLHLMESGASLEHVLHEVRQGAASSDATSAAVELVNRLLIGGDRDRDPMVAYFQMRAEGMPHARIVDDLKQHVMDTLDRTSADHTARTGESGS